jgi:hypothetical protein
VGAGLGLAAAEPMQVWGGGAVPWLVGTPPAMTGFLCFLVPGLLGGPLVAYIYSCAGGAGTT